jgi:hypothetical protein
LKRFCVAPSPAITQLKQGVNEINSVNSLEP